MIKVKDKKLLKIFGLRIRELRLERKYSQEQLANFAEIPLSQVGRIERGEINPTISTINVLALAFEIPLHELLMFPTTDSKKGR